MWKMDVPLSLVVLLLRAALVSMDEQTCPAVDTYESIQCGVPGLAGPPGFNGMEGQKGDKGEPGLPGVGGLPGPKGRQGLSGPKGNKGDSGAMGPPGLQGPTGDFGAPGLTGDRGDGSSLALDALNAQFNNLTAQVQDLQSGLDKQQKVLNLFRKTVTVGGKVYTSTGAEANYNDALTICLIAGGRLASPRSVAENNIVLSIRNYYATNTYLGINDLLTQGIFRYPTGEAITYANWGPSEPNNLATEFCVEMYNTGKWNNKPCEKPALVVCEASIAGL